jgi:hypothetical protein
MAVTISFRIARSRRIADRAMPKRILVAAGPDPEALGGWQGCRSGEPLRPKAGRSMWNNVKLLARGPCLRATNGGGRKMPEYVIEREMPGAGQLGADDLKMASQTSCSVLRDLGPQIQWVHSYVTDNKIYCIYRAPNEDMIREHAQRGGFPANKISQVRRTIDPTTAE